MSQDPLFDELFSEIESFVDLCKLVPTSIRTDIKRTISEEECDFWRQTLPEEIVTDYADLRGIVNQGVIKNKEKIDAYLVPFRQLSRWISEYPCRWSNYYKQINDSLRKIHLARREIDMAYKLGQYNPSRF